MPHEEVRKSRCRLTTTMMKRSSHMPTSTTPEIRKSQIGLVRSLGIQSTCGMTMLQMHQQVVKRRIRTVQAVPQQEGVVAIAAVPAHERFHHVAIGHDQARWPA